MLSARLLQESLSNKRSQSGIASKDNRERRRGNEMLIYLVITMTLSGQDFERRMVMDDLRLCWENAQQVMQELQDRHGEKLTAVGVGCTVEKEGDPA